MGKRAGSPGTDAFCGSLVPGSQPEQKEQQDMSQDATDVGSRFLATTLHEIRTPIQTIISTTELLEDSVMDKEQAEYVHQIEFSAGILLQLANNILDFTKIHAKEFKLESIPYDIIALTEHVIDLISIDAYNKGLEIITDIDYSMTHMVMGDPTRMQQIILNLLKNAVKFTPQGYVFIKLFKANGNIIFDVADSGIGVPAEKQKLIFNDFYQGDASITRKYGGTGLGLSISRKLVEIMGGKIGMRPNPSGGSVFWFSVPFIKSDIEQKEAKPEIPPGTKILIVDKNTMVLSSLARIFSGLGVTAVGTENNSMNAFQKLELASKSGAPFTIAFINMTMPQVDGWHLASAIRKNTAIKNLRLYLMVSEGQMRRDTKMKMSDLFDGYLYKPAKRAKLLSILRQTDEHTEADREAKAAAITADASIAAGRKILVAEDHPVNRKLLFQFLKRYGADIYLAEDGAQAVEQVAAHPEIDLIFMDMLMPVKSGTDATAELRGKNYRGIIIACTANNDQDDFNVYRQTGVNDILVKPFKREAVKQMLEKWSSVLAVPDAKSIVSLTDMNNKAADIWDVGTLIHSAGGNRKLAFSLMEDYIAQSQKLLVQIKQELAKPQKDLKRLELYAHLLESNSSARSAHKLAEHGKKMEASAKEGNLVAFEAARTCFAVDFLKLKLIIKNWEASV
ncbi:MAG TPA: hybrid sensor histidine kinase/response regulator [Treponema sp.]|nr:hybrid sensor histidine kinase/response regulator [Treponema sp.]